MAEDEKVGLTYPSMEGQGLEPVKLEREQLFPTKSGTLYPQPLPDLDCLKVNEVPNFLRERLETATERGHLARTLAHYAAQLSKADVLDARTLSKLKVLAKDAEAAGDYEDSKQVLKSITKFLGTIRMAKR